MDQHHHEMLEALRDPTKSLRRAIPDTSCGFVATHQAAMRDGVAPARINEATALAISVAPTVRRMHRISREGRSPGGCLTGRGCGTARGCVADGRRNCERVCASGLGGLPRRSGREEFLSRMSDSLLRITRAFAPRPVVFRTIDFRANEFRGLDGGEEFEPVEANPMIGYRGCYRYIREPDLFALELELLARVREETPNLHLMIPFVRTSGELEACLDAGDASPLGRQRGLHRWVMAEVPSVVYRIPEYAATGIDGGSVGSNDLTQLMLGVDRDSRVCRALRRVRRRGTRRDRLTAVDATALGPSTLLPPSTESYGRWRHRNGEAS